MKFPHRTVAITGASTGIGAELAVQLAAFGCKLALMARSKELLEAVAARVKQAGSEAVVLACDVGEFVQVQSALAQFEQAHGPLDCMVANAGIGRPVKPLEFDPTTPEQIMRVNYLGMTNCFAAVLPGMLARKRGHLVGVSSLASYQGLPQDGGYAASKAAQRIHCEGLRVELRGTGVDVTTICPGFVRTPMTDRNEFNMPLLVEVKPAVRGIVKAIACRRRMYHFPWLLWRLVRFGWGVPRWVFDFFVGWQAGKAATSGRTQQRSTEV